MIRLSDFGTFQLNERSTHAHVDPANERGRGWALVAIVEGRPSLFSLPARGAVVLGRGGSSDIAIDHASVSRRHAKLTLGEETVSIEDLGSANGSKVLTVMAQPLHTAQTREERLVPGKPVTLAAESSIHLGSVVVLLQRVSASAGGPIGLDIIAESQAMKRVLELVARIAQSPLSVLLLGETGVGKEVVARALHAASPRRGGPFVAINCAALPAHLVESELFGHERGAFTGAHAPKAGLLEEASGGTALLDEIGELPLAQQSKLLRALEDGVIVRVGAVKPRPIDVRYVAATNRDLAREAAEGHAFRRDLYFRLAGMTVAIPPLRERAEDIEPLAAAFAERAARALGRPAPRFEAKALAKLRSHAYPGNVRELRNVVERAVALASDVVEVEHLVLDDVLAAQTTQAAPPPVDERDTERQRIVDALARCAGNQTRAAALLGISRRTLVSRLTEYGIARPLRPRGE